MWSFLRLLLLVPFLLATPSLAYRAGGIHTHLQAFNVFGMWPSNWLNPNVYYTPGLGNPAVSTADYYHLDGLYWMRPYDLTDAACGATGASIAASRGRYVWIAGPDHPSSQYSWNDGQDFRAGYSNDPGVLPSTLNTIILSSNVIANVTTATFTGTISGTTLTTGAITGKIALASFINGTGVTANTQVSSQLTGTLGDAGTYSVNKSQSVGPLAMTATQPNYALYQAPFLVCNPDDGSFPFYLYGEGTSTSDSNFIHEEGSAKSADLLTWTVIGPSHVIKSFQSWTSFERVVRDGANSWHSTGLQAYMNVNAFGNGVWTSSDGLVFTPNTSIFNSSNISLSAAPDKTVVGGQTYEIGNVNDFVVRAPIDANYNLLTNPPPIINLSTQYAQVYPGPTFMNAVNAYIEDGVAHYYTNVGFPPSSASEGLVNGATYQNGGGLWQQAVDYYTEVIDASAAVNAAPVGITVSCNHDKASISWYDALPNKTYRVYRGTVSAQATLLGSPVGIAFDDDSAPDQTNNYYKIVTLNSGTEEKSRVVNSYCSSSSAFVNAHITRALAAGADPATIDRAWLDVVYNWLRDNNLLTSLMLWTNPSFGVIKSGSVISTIMDLGTTQLPRGGDYTTDSANTTYAAAGLRGFPAWSNTASAQGHYGGPGTTAIPGRINNIRRKTQITAVAAYQKPNTNVATFLSTGRTSNQLILQHTAGSPGSASFTLGDATHEVTATATISGLATDPHIIAGTFDGTTLVAYADGVAGTGQGGLVIPIAALTTNGNNDVLTGQTGGFPYPFLGSGSSNSMYTPGTGYVYDNNFAQFSGSDLIVFEKALTGAQIQSLTTLISGRTN